MLSFARIAVGEGTPLGCASCAAQREPRYYPASQVIEAVRAAVVDWEGPGPNLLLAGPEPFAHPELPALVSACVEAGADRIAIETDGAALSVPANAVGVLSAGVSHMHVRLLDADDAHGRTRDSLAGMAAYLQAAQAAGTTVCLVAVVPVCRHNLITLPDTVLQLASLGVHAVRLLSGGQLPAAAAATIAAACDTGMVNGVWVETDGLLPLPDTHVLHSVPEGSDG